jgi:hypothetical protein
MMICGENIPNLEVTTQQITSFRTHNTGITATNYFSLHLVKDSLHRKMFQTEVVHLYDSHFVTRANVPNKSCPT